MSASLLLSCVGVATRPGSYPRAKETALAAPTLCTVYGLDGWMDGLLACAEQCVMLINQSIELKALLYTIFIAIC